MTVPLRFGYDAPTMDASGPSNSQGKTLQAYRDANRRVTRAELAEQEEAARAGAPQGKGIGDYHPSGSKITVTQPAVPPKGKSFQDYMAASQGRTPPPPTPTPADTAEGKSIEDYAAAARKSAPR